MVTVSGRSIPIWVLVTMSVAAVGLGVGTAYVIIGPPIITGPPTVTIASYLPLQSSSLSQNESRSSDNAVEMAIEERNDMAGDVKINYAPHDATAQPGDQPNCTQSAENAAGDDQIVGWIGPLDSGCAEEQIPILNQAEPGPLAMISPSATYLGFTEPDPRFNDWWTYIPTGQRSFARLVPAHDKQGRAGAVWLKDLRVESVFIIYDDQEPYSIRLGEQFNLRANELDVDVVGRRGIVGDAADYRSLMEDIAQLDPDAIYFAGDNNAAQLLRDKVEVVGEDVIFMGTDAIHEENFLDDAGVAAEGIYVTSSILPLDQLRDTGKKFIDSYNEEFRSDPDPHAAYAYEATNVMLDAIERAYEEDGEVTRENVLREVFATEDYQGVLGTWSFEKYGNSTYASGDTTLTRVSGQRVEEGKFVPDRILDAGKGR